MGLFYFLVFFLLFFALIIGRKKFSLIYILISVGLLAFLAMFRSANVGNDTDTYVNLFYKIAEGTDLSVYSARYEIGYLYLNKLLSYISKNHQILLIITSLYTFAILGRFIYKYSRIPWMSVFMFFSLRYYDISLSGIRQMLAIATILIAYEFIVEKNLKKFILTIMVAVSFHNAAIIFLAAYPLSRCKLNKKIVLITGAISVVFYAVLDSVINSVLIYFPRYYSYVNDVKAEGEVKTATLIGLAMTIVILLACELFNKRIKSRNTLSKSKTLKNREDQMQSLFLLIACAIMFIALKVDILQRFKNIYGIFAIIYLPNSIVKISDNALRRLIIIITVVLFFAYIATIHLFRPEWQSTYPYTFCWN